jgi:hypothetical protein
VKLTKPTSEEFAKIRKTNYNIMILNRLNNGGSVGTGGVWEMDSCSDDDWTEGSHPVHPTLYLSKRKPGSRALRQRNPTETPSPI